MRSPAGPRREPRGVSVAVGRLNRALLTLNFRRELIYLSDDQIMQGPYVR
jgi:hypothetical protein